MAQHLSLAQLHEQFTTLQAEYKKLAERQRLIERVFQTYGISGFWVSTQQAADLLSVGKEGVLQHIRRAERFREAGIECECKYGVHYRQVPKTKDEPSDRPTWQVHVENFEKLLAIPLNNLKAG